MTTERERLSRPQTSDADLADLRSYGVTLSNWMSSPANRISFHRVRDLVETVPALADPRRTWPLEPADPAVVAASADVQVRGTTDRLVGLDELLNQTHSDALVVLHRGRLVLENYRNGMRADRQHLCMSVSKSITGTVAGRLVSSEVLDPASAVTDLVPELGGSGLDGATVRHLLDMRTGTSEDITTVELQRAYYAGIGWAPPAPGMEAHPDSRAHFARFRRVRPHGTHFEYRSTLTCVLAMICERVCGRPFPELLADLWQALGAEHSAEIAVDREGHAIADIGVSCTARDLARLGETLRREGRHPDGTPVVSPTWVAETVTDQADLRSAFEQHGAVFLPSPRGFYRNQWWVGQGRDRLRAAQYSALGIHGQLLFVDEEHEVVISKFSSWPEPWVERAALATRRACAALATAAAEADGQRITLSRR